MSDKDRNKTIILQVVHGERQLDDLQLAGITIEIKENRLTEHNPNRLTVAVTFRDVAQGLLALYHEPEQLRRLAFALHGCDFARLPDSHDPDHEFMMVCLWEAAFYESFSDTTLQELRRIFSDPSER